ncbi:FecR domain-containing protein [Pedobacter sp. KLB.chiD]|uniref:FecR domain-containing protein n=1 Tax=Pedobacter sp. KLB.chiD TaxID=3387402 RepID=UPI00399B46DD
MTKQDYTTFTISDFLEDPDFLRHVKYQLPEDRLFWKNWQEAKPENLAAYLAAELQLQLMLSPKPLKTPPGLEENLLATIHQSIAKGHKRLRIRRQQYYWAGGIAASLFMVLFISWFFNATVRIHTTYGERKKITLPDGSEVILNANSTLSYPRAYAWKQNRAVKLEGEAYFKVKHLNRDIAQVKRGELFTAQTGTIEVQVLGTTFNIRERRGMAHVALIEGSVRVRSVKTGQRYQMKPGNVVQINSRNGLLTVEKQGSLQQSAWTDGRLIVNQTTVNEILRDFEDVYGYRVILDDPALGDKKIDGSISIKSEEGLLFTLSHILNVNIQKQGKVIYLKNR